MYVCTYLAMACRRRSGAWSSFWRSLAASVRLWRSRLQMWRPSCRASSAAQAAARGELAGTQQRLEQVERHLQAQAAGLEQLQADREAAERRVGCCMEG